MLTASTKIVPVDLDVGPVSARFGQCLACAALVVLDDEGSNAADHRAWHDQARRLDAVASELEKVARDAREIVTEATAVDLGRALNLIARAFQGDDIGT